MTKLRFMPCLVITIAMLSGSAFALTIRVAPQALVLSSQGGNLTVHTDIPYWEAGMVTLTVNGSTFDPRTFADNLGNLVAQCSKQDVKEAVGDFDGNHVSHKRRCHLGHICSPCGDRLYRLPVGAACACVSKIQPGGHQQCDRYHRRYVQRRTGDQGSKRRGTHRGALS